MLGYSIMVGFDKLLKEVINTGLCCFCGTCRSVCPLVCISLDYENEEPFKSGEGKCPSACSSCWDNCPGKKTDYNEIELRIFGRTRNTSELLLGIKKYLARGHALSKKIREAGTSGGVGTALLYFALKSKLVEGAVIASTDSEIPWRGIPCCTSSLYELEKNARSKYVPIPMNSAIREASIMFNKFAITALPCQVAGIRKAQINNVKEYQKIEFIIGISCGYCAYGLMYEHLIKEVLNTPLQEVSHVEFRGGDYPGEFKVYKKDGDSVSCPTQVRSAIAFSYIRDRCSMCIDWNAELADISLADLFTHKVFDEQGKAIGNTAITVRTTKGEKIIKEAERNGFINTFQLNDKELYGNIGIEWKKHGFANHLQNRAKRGLPVPYFGYSLDMKPWLRTMHIYDPDPEIK